MSDPFAEIREDCEQYGALDEQSPNKQNVIQVKIKEMYAEFGTVKDFVLTTAVIDNWIAATAEALMHVPEFQAVILDNAVGLYAHKPPTITIKSAWFAGLYLPGFYDTYESFQDGLNAFLEVNQVEIVEAAQMGIKILLQNAEHKLMTTEQKDALKTTMTPIGDLTPEMMSMCQLAKQEKSEAATRNRLVLSVKSLGPLLSSLPASSALMEKCQEIASAKQGSTFQKFGSGCLSILEKAGMLTHTLMKIKKMPLLDDAAKELIKAAKSTNFVLGKSVKGQRKADAADDDGEEGDSKNTKRKADKDLDLVVDRSAQQVALQEYFEKQEQPVTYPCWTSPETAIKVQHHEIKALSNLPSIKATMEMTLQRNNKRVEQEKNVLTSTQSRDTLLKTIWRQSSSFKAGRMLSEKELEESMPTEQSLLDSCLAEVQRSVNVSYSKETDGRLRKLLTNLGDTTSRPWNAAGEKITSTWQAYTEMGLYDNWFHVRKLIQAIRFVMGGDEDAVTPDQLKKAELEIRNLLAAIQGAEANPLPWMLTIDHVLRNVWQSCSEWYAKKKNPKASGKAGKSAKVEADDELEGMDDAEKWTLIKNLFAELALFAQGAAIFAGVRRFSYTKLFKDLDIGNEGQGGDPGRYLEWYRLLYAIEPRCANMDCNRLLPDPDTFRKIDFAKDVFSIGTKDARAGKKVVRQFISTNRDDCYPCFISAFQSRAATPLLAAIFCYYSQLFHTAGSAGCKDARGKRSIPGFA